MRQNNEKIIQKAVQVLCGGGLAALPTETVYGLSADCENEAALAHLRAAKNRPDTQAISILVASLEKARQYATELPETAIELAQKHWPGPLTLVVKKSKAVSDLVTAGGDTVGVRVPNHPLTLAILRELGRGLATPSANIAGAPSPTRVEDIDTELLKHIDIVVDGGPCTLGTASTIIDATGEKPVILRQGSLSV